MHSNPQAVKASVTMEIPKGGSFRLVVEIMGVSLRFAVANSSWTSGTMQRLLRVIVRTFKILLWEWRHPLADWVQVVPVVP